MHRAVSHALANAGIDRERLLLPDDNIVKRAFTHLCRVYDLPLPPYSGAPLAAGNSRRNATPLEEFELPPSLALFAAIRAYLMDAGYYDFSMEDFSFPRGDRLSAQLDALAQFGEFREAQLQSISPAFQKARALQTELETLEQQINGKQDRAFSLKRHLGQLLPEHKVRLAVYEMDRQEVESLGASSQNLELQLQEATKSLALRERSIDGDEQIAKNEFEMYAQLVDLLLEGSLPEDQLKTTRIALDKARSEKQEARSQLESCRTTSQLLLDLEKNLPNLIESARRASNALSAQQTAESDFQRQTKALDELLAELKRCENEKSELSACISAAKARAESLAQKLENQQLLRKEKENEFDLQEQEINTRVAEHDLQIAAYGDENARLEEEIAALEAQMKFLEPKLLAQESQLEDSAKQMMSLLLKLSAEYPPSSRGGGLT